MGKPQDLPAGVEQVKVGVGLAMVTYILALAAPYGLARSLFQAVIDLGLTALILYIALMAVGRRARFEQAYGGLCGASAFINLAAVPLYLTRGDGATSFSPLADFVLLVWGLSLLGHIIRHTFEISMLLSTVISFVFFVFMSALISSLLPPDVVLETGVSMLGEEVLLTTAQLLGQWQLG